MWASHVGEDLPFHVEEPPAELVRFVREQHPSPGGALDVGCGIGVVARSLAGSFRPTVGVDVALGAIRQARERTAGDSVRFVVAEAPYLPFRDRAFAIVVDRGCLHSIARTAWPAYLSEVARLLTPGGAFHLYYAQPYPPLLSPRGIRARLARILRRRPPARLSPALAARLMPERLDLSELEVVPVTLAAGRSVAFSHLVCRRRPDGARAHSGPAVRGSARPSERP